MLMVLWGVHQLQMFLLIHNSRLCSSLLKMKQINLSFIRDKCCHLKLCLHLVEPNWLATFSPPLCLDWFLGYFIPLFNLGFLISRYKSFSLTRGPSTRLSSSCSTRGWSTAEIFSSTGRPSCSRPFRTSRSITSKSPKRRSWRSPEWRSPLRSGWSTTSHTRSST